MPPYSFVGAGAALAALCIPCAAVQIKDYDQRPEYHDRFERDAEGQYWPTQSREFMLDGIDLSGVGWVGDARANPSRVGRAVTLVSRRHILFATHWPVRADAYIQFMNADGELFSYRVTSTRTMRRASGGDSDLSIATLDADVDPSIKSYAIAPNDGMNFHEHDLIVYGKNGKVGTQELASYWSPMMDIAPWRWGSLHAAPSGTAVSENGDSGSPTFIRLGNHLVVVGVRWLQTVDTWVPAYLNQLLEATGETGGGLEVYGETVEVWPCRPDFNDDGRLSFEDIFGFLDAYQTNDSHADFAEPHGVFNVTDVVGFLDAFEIGCGS